MLLYSTTTCLHVCVLRHLYFVRLEDDWLAYLEELVAGIYLHSLPLYKKHTWAGILPLATKQVRRLLINK